MRRVDPVGLMPAWRRRDSRADCRKDCGPEFSTSPLTQTLTVRTWETDTERSNCLMYLLSSVLIASSSSATVLPAAVILRPVED